MNQTKLKSEKQSSGLIVVCAAIVVQLCVGTAYIWSVFQSGIAKYIFSGDNALAGLSFSIQLVVLTIGSVFGGKLAAKYSIKTVVMVGCLLMSLGFFLASFTTPYFPYLLWITYGCIGGIGMGMTYTTTIACAQEWYPTKKGLVTGVIVAALGLGGVIFAPIAEMLVSKFGEGVAGVGELKTFMVISGIFLVVGLSVVQLLKSAPKVDAATAAANPAATADRSLTTKQALRTPHFYFLILAFGLACIGGLMMIGFAKPIADAKGLGEAATLGVLFISIFNSVGRLAWGAISDKLGRMTTILLIITGSIVMSLIVNSAEGYYVLGAICLIGFFYGGILSNFPAITADLFGVRHLAVNYGVVLLGFGVGAIVSSFVAGHYKNLAADDINLMTPAFLIAAACGVTSWLIMFCIYKTRKYIK